MEMQMPLYDCGSPECDECQKAFGPDRSEAIRKYKQREKTMNHLWRLKNDPTYSGMGLGDVYTFEDFERSERQ
jgi:hypothetical protein